MTAANSYDVDNNQGSSEFFLCASSHSKHSTYIALFNWFQQLTEVDIILFYIVEMTKGGY